MLDPVGEEYWYDIYTPTQKHITEIITATIVTDLNVLQIRIALKEGNTKRLDINNVPIMRIPRTTVMAVNNAIIIL